jgi:tetratricopeptide (TPR) repeat protein
VTSVIQSILIWGSSLPLRNQISKTFASILDDRNVVLERDYEKIARRIQRQPPSLLMIEWNAFSLTEVSDLMDLIRNLPGFLHLPVVIFANKATGDLAAIAVQHNISRIFVNTQNWDTKTRELEKIVHEASRPSSYHASLTALDRARQRKDMTAYENIASRLLLQHPDAPRARLEFAALSLAKRDYPRAINEAKLVMREHPDSIRAMSIIANASFPTQNYQDSLRIFENAKLIQEDGIETMLQLCEGLLAIEHMRRSGHYYETTLKIEAACTAARRALKIITLSESQLNQAVSLVKEIEDRKEIASICNNIAIHSARGGHLARAEAAYNVALRAIEMDSTKAKIHFNLGLAFERFEEFTRARESYQTALEFDRSFSKCKARLEQCNPTIEEIQLDTKCLTRSAEFPKTTSDILSKFKNERQTVPTFGDSPISASRPTTTLERTGNKKLPE